MEVFDGGKFLESKATKLVFSNGTEVTVTDITDVQMKKMDELGKDENPSTESVREVAAAMMNIDVTQISTVGIVELRGAMDFLTERLFG